MHKASSVVSVLLATTALLTACATPAPTPNGSASPPETISYRCAGAAEIVVVYAGRAAGTEGTATLTWEGHSFVLKQDISGSGARYTDGTLSLSSKGDEAFVEKAGEMVLRDCNAQRITS